MLTRENQLDVLEDIRDNIRELDTNTEVVGRVGVDYSINKPTLMTLLATVPANLNRVGFYVQNQSASQLQVVLSESASGTNYTVILLDAGNGANGQGADWSMVQAGIKHIGIIRIYGIAASQFGLREY